MKRTNYFNHTKPGQDQLNYTESTRIATLLERFRSTSQFGVRSGFNVTVNGADTTKIDVGVGEGYTGGFFSTADLRGVNSGERISTETTTVTGQALADYTNGISNYVSLVYSEISSIPLPERDFPFASYNTKIEDSFTVSVLSATNWNLLTAEQKQQRVLVAIVTANGAGVPLTTSSIEQVIQAKSHPICSASSIAGVTIKGVSSLLTQGTATLIFTAPSSFSFAAPNDAGGAVVTVTNSGEWTIYSSSTQYYIIIDVVFASLPLVNTTESLTVSSLYGRNIPLASAADIAHRDLVGSAPVTPTNPHGTAVSDLLWNALAHGGLFHLNGISHKADPTQLRPSLFFNDVVINNLGGSTNTFLIASIEYQLIDGKIAGSNGTVTFGPGDPSGDYLIYLDASAREQKILLADFTPVAPIDPVLFSANIEIYDMHNTIIGVANASVTWTAADRTLQYTAPGDVIGAAVYVNTLTVGGTDYYGFYKLYSANGTDWVLVWVDGDLGITATSTFSSLKSEGTTADSIILKLGVVTWDLVNTNLRNIRDNRKFLTADNREQVLEEHDVIGQHTKELRNTLRLGTASNAIMAVAKDNSAIIGIARSGVAGVYGSAPNTAVYGVAATVRGVVGSAPNTAVYGTATAGGVVGSAPNTGVYGIGITARGVVGSAPNTAVYGTAATAGGVVGIAPDAAGVYGSATVSGVHGRAVDYGVYGSASAPGGNYGVYGAAGTNGVYGSALTNGVHGWASVCGVRGTAFDNTAIWGFAHTNYGVIGSAANAYGVSGSAKTFGVAGAASNTAVYGSAATQYGVYGVATSIGVYGSGVNIYGILGTGGAGGIFGEAGAGFGVGASGGVYDLYLAHGGALPAILFDQIVNGTGGGIAIKGILVSAGGAKYLLPLFATA